MTTLSQLERLLLVIAFIALFVLSPIIGSLGSVIAVVASIILAVFALRKGPASETPVLTLDLQLLFAAFVGLALVFGLTADDWTDVRYAANFLALPLAVAVRFHYARYFSRSGAFLFWLCLAGAIASALIALFDVSVRELDRAEGFFGGPNLLSRTAIVLGFVAVGGVVVVAGRKRLLFYLGPACAAVATFYSGSRGAALAIPVLAIVAIVFLAVRSDTRRHVVAGVALIVAALGAALLTVEADSLLARFTDLPNVLGAVLATGTSDNYSTNLRLEMIHAAIEAFQSSPWLGYGWANLSKAAYPIMGSLVQGPNDTGFQFHNDTANFAVAGGIVGIAAWLIILSAPSLGAVSTPRDELFALRLYVALVLGLAYLIFGMTDMSLGYDLPTTLFAFTVGIVGGLRGRTRARVTDRVRSPPTRTRIALSRSQFPQTVPRCSSTRA